MFKSGAELYTEEKAEGPGAQYRFLTVLKNFLIMKLNINQVLIELIFGRYVDFDNKKLLKNLK